VGKTEFGDYIGRLRTGRGYVSQRQLAIDAGVSPSTVKRIEDGSQRAEPDTLRKLAPHLGVSYKALLEKAGYSEGVDENDIEHSWPEGIRVLRRADEKLTLEKKKTLLKLMNAYTDAEGKK